MWFCNISSIPRALGSNKITLSFITPRFQFLSLLRTVNVTLGNNTFLIERRPEVVQSPF